MKQIFATNNLHKLHEIRNALPEAYQVSGLAESGIIEEIPETKDTLEGNAIDKAKFIYEKYGMACFADDTGLEVDALQGRPGVYSARYAGENCSFEDNVNKLLAEMEGIKNRNAQFRTVIAFIENGNVHCFEGLVKGKITTEKKGHEGFGYDPVFLPENQTLTFAEMPLEQKNLISHRSRALMKFIEFLSKPIK